MPALDYQEILAVIGIVIGFVSYAVYFRSIFKGETKPHLFTWFTWAMMGTTVFFAQIARDGGAGAWITASNAVMCLAVAALALKYGEKHITKSDWFSLLGAAIGIAGWAITKNPLTGVILICITDCFAIWPTFRKAYHKPEEENAAAFSIDLVKFILELVALKSFNFTTALFPAVIIINDTALVAMILVRRRILSRSQ